MRIINYYIPFINNVNTNSIEKELSTPMKNQPLSESALHDSPPILSNCRVSNNDDQRFESLVEELKMYIDTNGHMNVTRKESESLYFWIVNIRRRYKNMQEGWNSNFNLSPDRMNMLEQIGFKFKNTNSVEQMDFDYMPNKYRTSVPDVPSTSFTPFKRQRSDERLKPISTAHENANKEMLDEIEGDIIPRWFFDYEEGEELGEQDNSDDSFSDQIYIKVDGEIEVEGRSNNAGYLKVSYEDSEEEAFLVEKDNVEVCGDPTPSWLFNEDDDSSCTSSDSNLSTHHKSFEMVSGIEDERNEPQTIDI